ncbi:uncharacterized protein EI90DRAFT_3132323 [Cantharellus anzutake]|uniref:uncharacterized protein n=1 Tax=Cantharellus anzutake TaxID=1750568 RepID=UPI001908A893|nr:uncharacterized protein EI90DRAFT_3132323 [Cantharellus anzutake]KAF8319817.1 hypothetical protein EI90DRAFT_3132323 [Cantharellus anzutake]
MALLTGNDCLSVATSVMGRLWGLSHGSGNTMIKKQHSPSSPRGIIHEDVEPSNLVNPRFIHFAEAVLESESPCRHASSTHFVSPSSQIVTPAAYRSSAWVRGERIFRRICTGRLPFEDIVEDDVDLLIKEGLHPDLSLIDDGAVKALIREYLDGGE